MLAIAKGSLSLALFGPVSQGRRSVLLSMPVRSTQAIAPFLFGPVLEAGPAIPGIAPSTALSPIALAAHLISVHNTTNQG